MGKLSAKARIGGQHNGEAAGEPLVVVHSLRTWICSRAIRNQKQDTMTDLFQPNPLGRRSVLHAFGAAAGLSLLNEVVAADKVPGTQVEDRSSSIRLTGLTAHWVGPIVYVKLQTNHGIS